MFLEKPNRRLRWLSRSSTSILILSGILVGCDHTKISVSTVSSPYVHKMDEFLPLDGGQKDASFTVDGTKTNYTLTTKQVGTTVHFQALSEGTLIDEEVYDIQGKTILLKKAAGENFIPPVTLIQFPLDVGEQYPWKGKLACEMDQIDGTATVTTSTDFVPVNDKSEDAIKVEVNLKFGTGATRKLAFWFVKGHGVLKTEMAKNIREPKQ